MPTKRDLRHLQELCDVLGLCSYLGEMLDYNPANCDDSYRYTRQYFSEYSPDVDVEQAINLLARMGANCDCEVGFQICPEVGA